jgi:hypothetical protein
VSHPCAAPGCDKVVSDALLMCLPHWRRVPELQQHAVWRTWRALQRSNSQTYFVRLDAYRKAKDVAIAAVSEQAAA